MSSHDWQTFETKDGKKYYFNKKTNTTTWDKPDEMLTETERAHIQASDWQEFKTPEGKPYYYHPVTKETVWVRPASLNAPGVNQNTQNQTNQQAQNNQYPVNQNVQAQGVAMPMPGMMPMPFMPVQPFGMPFNKLVPPPSFNPMMMNPMMPNPMMMNPMMPNPMMPNPMLNPMIQRPFAAPASTPAAMPSAAAPVASAESSTSYPSVRSYAPVDSSAPSNITITSTGISALIRPDALPPGVSNTPISMLAPSKQVGISTVDNTERKYENPELAFETLLEDFGIKSFWKWETAMPVIINDKRYMAMKSIDDKKRVFKSYQEKIVAKEQEQEKKIMKTQKDNFYSLLQERTDIHPRAKFREARILLESDSRFKAVSSDRDREDWFYSFMEKKEADEKEARRVKRKTLMNEFENIIKNRCSFFTHDTTWRELNEKLLEMPEASNLNELPLDDRMRCFEDYRAKLKEADREKRALEADKLRQIEKQQRNEFRSILESHLNKIEFHSKTKYERFEPILVKSADFIAMNTIAASERVNEDGSIEKIPSAPRELRINFKTLFDDFCDDLGRKQEKDKKNLKELLKNSAYEVTMNDNPVTLYEKYVEWGVVGQDMKIEKTQALILLYEMIDKAKWKHEQALLKQAEYESVFCQLLERKLLSRFQTIAATVIAKSRMAGTDVSTLDAAELAVYIPVFSELKPELSEYSAYRKLSEQQCSSVYALFAPKFLAICVKKMNQSSAENKMEDCKEDLNNGKKSKHDENSSLKRSHDDESKNESEKSKRSKTNH